jgi:hypothetical protein
MHGTQALADLHLILSNLNEHAWKTVKFIAWVCLKLCLSAHNLHWLGGPTYFNLAPRLPWPGHLHRGQNMPRQKEKKNEKYLYSRLSNILPSSEPQQRNRILLLCCLPLFTLARQIQ